jgi:ADP-L-glycero-D-manno-heptose 6-epimerase
MYLVTGGAGFIGSHLVKALNEQGVDDVLVADDMSSAGKIAHLSHCTIADYMDRAELRAALAQPDALPDLTAILHQGACTDTMESDGRYVMDNNFTFSKLLLGLALRRGIPFVYASSAAVYGAGSRFEEIPDNERPLNVYGYSKLASDQYVRRVLPDAASSVVGLRYFNVYGPNEDQKGRMASMVYQLFHQLRDHRVARLFEGTDGYGDGEQRRDFVFVGDVVKVNLFFAGGPTRKGIYNVGTGNARSFNDIAQTIIDLQGGGRIEYIPFPDGLRGKYQNFTEADVTRLRAAGYQDEFTALEDGIAQCVDAWTA